MALISLFFTGLYKTSSPDDEPHLDLFYTRLLLHTQEHGLQLGARDLFVAMLGQLIAQVAQLRQSFHTSMQHRSGARDEMLRKKTSVERALRTSIE